jgi:threonine synthase
VGVAAARDIADGEGPVISLATAHPAKFPDAVTQACGHAPDIPERLAGVFDKDERYDVLPNDLDAVSAYVSERTRASVEAG